MEKFHVYLFYDLSKSIFWCIILSMKNKVIKEIFDLLKVVLISLAIVMPIRAFIFQPFMINGASMEPNYHSTDYLIIDQVSYRFEDPKRGDVIVFKYPGNPSVKYIKRVIALPGEAVEIDNGVIYITDNSGKRFELKEDYLPEDLKDHWVNKKDYSPILMKDGEYFVLGDNRNYSSDSRVWGVLPEKNIVGKIFFNLSISELLNGSKKEVNNKLIY